ncbi:hypothetical protein JIX56_42015 [Streptomyces sp. CA-210063]|nr:hypothetical protein [Streptomyces sp. CA-210063]UUU37448.1 hypothetical protein JIX56_42015 [Streptomyces sp. CA-210063]
MRRRLPQALTAVLVLATVSGCVDHARMLFNVKAVSPERYQEHLRGLADKGQRGFIPAGIEITDPAGNDEPRKL